jgi:Zn-dependent peptidase ImmA (M78 family)/DNA-binding transcriptional regulator YiaG
MTSRKFKDGPAREKAEETKQFNPAMLRIARGAVGMTQTELAALMTVSQGKVSKWEDGILSPSQDEIGKLGRILKRPAELFFQPDQLAGVDTSFLYHRRRRRVGLAVLNRLHDRINLMRIGVSRLLRNAEQLPCRFEHKDIDEHDSPEVVAQLMRAAWQVPRGPIRDLVGLIENAGGIVIPFDFETDLIDAVSQWPWGLPPLFFMNCVAPAERMRFSLAHEVGHVIMHRIPGPTLETEADRFASEFMMPARDARAELQGVNLERALRLKFKWGMSAQFVIRKARDVEAITDRRYQSLCAYVSKLGYRKREPNPLRPETPTTLRRIVDMHVHRLGYRPDNVRDLVFSSEEEFENQFLCVSPRQNGLRVMRG